MAAQARTNRETHSLKTGSSGKQVGMWSNTISRRFRAEVIMNWPHQESEGRVPSSATFPLVANWRTGVPLGMPATTPPTAEVSWPKVMPPTISPATSFCLNSATAFLASARLRTIPFWVMDSSGTTTSSPGTFPISARQRPRMSLAHSSWKGSR